jgi:peptidoglycan/xylan/chitin deacetylase (PgdA/CDA1 family)
MYRHLKSALLYVAKFLGLFALARHLTRRELRILCYHGASLYNEHKFRPGVFMTAATFERRMQLLARKRYPVLDLQDALTSLESGQMPDYGTVITIDDGWYGTHAVHAATLRACKYPATLYLSSYYMKHQSPVHRVATGYALWSGANQGAVLQLQLVDPRLSGTCRLKDFREMHAALAKLTELGDGLPSNSERTELFERLCAALRLDAAEIIKRRALAFMSFDEARSLAEQGMDLQLHTHRHTFPRHDEAALTREIVENRDALAQATSKPVTHLCYPSGVYFPEDLQTLRNLGVVSATTTERGFCRRGVSWLELPRIVDSEAISTVSFEAELCGFLELCRRARAVFLRSLSLIRLTTATPRTQRAV